MTQEMNEKRCTKCKNSKPIDQFYKNKLTPDGHSIYCVDCTKINSKKYFDKKKIESTKVENENLMKMALINNFNGKLDEKEASQLMKILMIEKMNNLITEEISNLKRFYIKSDEIIETGN